MRQLQPRIGESSHQGTAIHTSGVNCAGEEAHDSRGVGWSVEGILDGKTSDQVAALEIKPDFQNSYK